MEANKKSSANVLYAGRAFYVQFIEENKQDLVFSYETPAGIYDAVNKLLEAVNTNNIDILNKESFKFFSEPLDEKHQINESMTQEEEALLEFEMFNVNRRDVTSFADFLKKAKDITAIVKSGNDLSTRKFQAGFMHEIKRDPIFKHPAFDNLYKSFGEKDKKKREEQDGGNYTTPGAFPAGVGGF